MKYLRYINLCGVLLLAVLCIAQWRHDRRIVSSDLVESELYRSKQNARLVELTNSVNGLQGDLAQFKTSFSAENRLRLEGEARLRKAGATNERLELECGQLRAAITNWAAAAAERDEHIRQANEEIKKLSVDLNASIRKFNALVVNYNNLAHDMEVLRSRPMTNTPAQK